MTQPDNDASEIPVASAVPIGRADLKGRRSRLLEVVYPTERNLAEFNRTAVALLAMRWILNNDYESFTACQKGPHKLTEESFAWLVDFTRQTFAKPDNPTELDPTAIAAMEVFLVIHDLGKTLAQPGDLRDHDEILRDFLERNSENLQTFHELDERRQKYILDGLKLNIAQFVQGESIPASLSRIADTDRPGFDFNAVHILCDIAGAAGNVTQNGSLTMNEPTVKKFRHAIESLRQYFDGKTLDEVTDEYHSRIVQEFGLTELTDDPALRTLLTRTFLSLRQVDVEQARVDLEAFNRLPDQIRGELLREYNASGTQDGIGVMLYMSPAFLLNLDKNYPGGEGLERGYRVLHRIYGAARENPAARQGSGCFTVMIHDLADAALEDPESLDREFYLTAEGLNGEIIQPGRRERPGKLPVTAPPADRAVTPAPAPIAGGLSRATDDDERDDPSSPTGYVTAVARRNPEMFLLADPDVRATPEGFAGGRPDTVGDRIFPGSVTEDVWYRDLLVILTNDPKARYLPEKIVTHLKTASDPPSGQGVLTGVGRNRYFAVDLDEFAVDTVAELAASHEASKGSLHPWYETGSHWPNLHFVVAREELGDARAVLHEVARLSPPHTRRRQEGPSGQRTCVFSPYATAADYAGFPAKTRGFGLIGAARQLRDLDAGLLLRQFHTHAIPLNADPDAPDGDYLPIIDWSGVSDLYRVDPPGRGELQRLLASLTPLESVVEFAPRYSEGDPTSLIVDPGHATTVGLLRVLTLSQEYSTKADSVLAVPITVDFATGKTTPAHRRDRLIREQAAIMTARTSGRPGSVDIVTHNELYDRVIRGHASPSTVNALNQLRPSFTTGRIRRDPNPPGAGSGPAGPAR